MLKAYFAPYRLYFRFTARTSREVMTWKDTWYIAVTDSAHEDLPEHPECFGIGECALFHGLSYDDRPDYREQLSVVCSRINDIAEGDTGWLDQWPSIKFGIETALADYHNGCCRKPFPGAWSNGDKAITINGLVWMGSHEEMLSRVAEKIDAGFRCIKLKIGGIRFEDELNILRTIRERYDCDELQLRLDANGAFTPDNALVRLEQLARFGIHSIEQPLPASVDSATYRSVCRHSPIPVALDESLIGVDTSVGMCRLLDEVAPAYVILKPSLCGGFSGADKWITKAKERGIDYWVTSALESDIGLNAIAQWTSHKDISIPQGLGTGMLYTNNVVSPLVQRADTLQYNPEAKWILPKLEWAMH